MRLARTAHTSQPWRIHELTRDFRIEDVWALPTPGGPEDFPWLVRGFGARERSQRLSLPARTLWALRQRLGELLGWDDQRTGLDSLVASLRERLPEDLRERPAPEFAGPPFSSLYVLDDECAAELANATVHAVLHLGWVADERGGYRGQMAVLVKPNGLRGEAYMAAIKPFRHLIVYPSMLQRIERGWRTRPHDGGAPVAPSKLANAKGGPDAAVS
jgi:Protein of unknown function (DUF2867)